MPQKEWLPNPKLKPVYCYSEFHNKEVRSWELVEEYRFSIWSKEFVIPKWFRTDGASIPKCIRFFACPMDLPAVKAAIIHDYLYSTGLVSRSEADRIFKMLLIVVGVSDGKTLVYHRGVQIWWWYTRKKYRKIGWEKWKNSY